MSPYSAWYLPRGTSLEPHESSILDEESSPANAARIRVPNLTEERFTEIAQALRVAGEGILLQRPVSQIAEVLGRVGNRFLDPEDELRTRAIGQVRLHSGYSLEMAEEVVKGMARGWTEGSLQTLLSREFADPLVLDGFRPGTGGYRLRAMGYRLAVHFGAGTVPGVSVTSLIRSLLVKSPVLVKPGRGDVALPVLFAEALAEMDRELGRCVAVLYWPGFQSSVTDQALSLADVVVAYGADGTLDRIRSRLPAGVPFVGYRHRIGVGLVGRCRSEAERKATAMRAAKAMALFDQKGCVSPHLFFVASDSDEAAEEWASDLAEALTRMESVLPSGPLTPGEGSALEQVRGTLELREIGGSGRVLHGGREAPWTVAFDPEGTVEPSCLNRTVRVVPVRSVMDALPHMERWRRYLQTVGVAEIDEDEADLLAERLARLGVTRIVPLEEVPWPDPWWHHDGSGPLQVLVQWADWTGELRISSGGVGVWQPGRE